MDVEDITFIENNEFVLSFLSRHVRKKPISFKFLSLYFVVLDNLTDLGLTYDFGKPVI